MQGCCVIMYYTICNTQVNIFEFLVSVHIRCYSMFIRQKVGLYYVSTAVKIGSLVAHFLFRTKCNKTALYCNTKGK